MQSGTGGAFGFFPQTAVATEPTVDEYYWMEGNLVQPGPQQLVRNVGQTVGGSFLPARSLKTAAWSGGRLVLPPVMVGYLGWFFHAFAGSYSGVDNTDGTFTFTFPDSGLDNDPPAARYLAFHKIIPVDGGGNFAETMLDQIPHTITLGCVPGELATCQMDFLGRSFSSEDDASGTGWTPGDYEDIGILPLITKGHFELPDGSAADNATGVTIELRNLIPDLRRVLVAGSYYPLGFPVMGRALTVSWTALWKNATLYKACYYNASGAWNPSVYSTDLDILMESPLDAYGTGLDLPMSLKFFGGQVEWEAEPISLQGGDLIEMRMTGTLTNTASGTDWYLALTNEQAVDYYDWPT